MVIQADHREQNTQVNSYVVGIGEVGRSVKPSALPCQQLLIRHHTLCGVMRKLRARMADMGTACYVCAWPVLKRRVGDSEHMSGQWCCRASPGP